MSRVFLQEEGNFEFRHRQRQISLHSASIIFLHHAIDAFFALKVKHESQIRSYLYRSYIYNENNLNTQPRLP